MWLEVGSSSITGVNSQVKVLLSTEPRAHMFFFFFFNTKRGKVKADASVLEATVPSATCAHIIFTDETFTDLQSRLFCARFAERQFWY